MVRNMGIVDRVVRLVVAVAVAILVIAGVLTGAGAIVLGIVAAIFLVTGIVGTCPLYLLFRISTRRKV